MIGIVAAVAGFLLVIGLRYPAFFTMPELRGAYTQPWFRVVLFGILFVAYAAAVLNLTLRRTKTLGATAIVITLFASLLGGSRVQYDGSFSSDFFLGLDWFVLNVIFTGLLFVPLERLFPHRADQNLFRDEWREDLFYYLAACRT